MDNRQSIRRTRWSFRVTLDPSSGAVFQSWPEGRRRFVGAFRAAAERYRRRNRAGIVLFIVSMLGGLALMAINVFERTRILGIALSMACMAVACLILVFGQKLLCPACRKRLEPASGLYCPQCGSDQFEPGRSAYCYSCDIRITEEDGDSARSYWIHGCTHCGVLLDEKGL